MNKQANEQVNKQTNEQVNKQTNNSLFRGMGTHVVPHVSGFGSHCTAQLRDTLILNLNLYLEVFFGE